MTKTATPTTFNQSAHHAPPHGVTQATTTAESTAPRSVEPMSGANFMTGLVVFSMRSLKHSFRDAESLLMAVILPIMLMLIFTYVMGGAMDVSGDGSTSSAQYLSYVLPAIVVTAAGFGASYTAVVVSNDMTTGFMNRLRTMPFPSVTVLLGHTVSSMVRNLLATAVVFAVALAVGFRTDASVAQWAGSVGLVALWILVITVVFAVLGMIAGSAESASGYGFMLLFLPYVSSGFAPVESMPDWLQGFAEHQPMTPIIDASRALLNGETPGNEWWIGMLWCAGFVALAVWMAAVLFPKKVAR